MAESDEKNFDVATTHQPLHHRHPPGKPKKTGRVLKACYAEHLQDSFPFRKDVMQCQDEAEAFWWSLQSHFLEIDPELDFQNLNQHISEAHRAQIQPVWHLLIANNRNWHDAISGLQAHWGKKPEISDLSVDEIITAARIQTHDAGLEIIKAVIAEDTGGDASVEDHGNLREWQTTEKALRLNLFTSFKEYITNLRFYYELMLESEPMTKPAPQDQRAADMAQSAAFGWTPETVAAETQAPVATPPKKARKSVFPRNNPSLKGTVKKLLEANRYSRVIDTVLHSIIIARGIHHEQPPESGKDDKRVRKTGGAYIDHPWESQLFALKNYIPFLVKNERMGDHVFLSLLIVLAFHDTVEDSKYPLAETLGKIKAYLDNYDISIGQTVEFSPMGRKMSEFSKSVLDILIGNCDLDNVIGPCLRAMNKNDKLTTHEKIAAVSRGIFGREKTMELLGDLAPEEKAWLEGAPTNSNGKLKIADAFPASGNDAVDKFFVRVFAIADVRAAQQPGPEQSKKVFNEILETTYLAKLSERHHNTTTMEPDNFGYRRKNLRANARRLAAFGMLDWDAGITNNLPPDNITTKPARGVRNPKDPWKKKKTFNILPEFIRATLEEYQKLKTDVEGKKDHKEQAWWQAEDEENLTTLQRWHSETAKDVRDYVEHVPEPVRDNVIAFRERVSKTLGPSPANLPTAVETEPVAA